MVINWILSLRQEVVSPNISNAIETQRFMDQQKLMGMTKEDPVETIVRILKTERDLDFLLKLGSKQVRILVA